jgi:hypothetical protein
MCVGVSAFAILCTCDNVCNAQHVFPTTMQFQPYKLSASGQVRATAYVCAFDCVCARARRSSAARRCFVGALDSAVRGCVRLHREDMCIAGVVLLMMDTAMSVLFVGVETAV